jgi:hypothetical protein
VLQALSAASLGMAAPAFGLEPEAAAAALREAGYGEALPDDTLGAIAARHDQGALAVMTVLATARP